MLALVGEFVEIAKQKNQEYVISFLPDNRSVDYYEATGNWEYQPVIDALGEKGIRTSRLGNRFLRTLENRGFCSILGSPRNCSGHFSAEGYHLLAEIMKDVLLEEHLSKFAGVITPLP